MRPKACIVSSAGGHLTEVLALEEVFKDLEHYFVTFDRPDAREKLRGEKVYFVKDPKRNPLKLILNLLQSFFIFLKERPDVVISTGAGVALPTVLIAKFFGKRVIFVETMAAVRSPSLTGRLAYRFSDLFIVQWKSLKRFYPKAVYGGTLV